MNAPTTPESAESSTKDLSGLDENLKRVVQVIVAKFQGDTAAYYESIRGKSEESASESDDLVAQALCTKHYEFLGSRGTKAK